MPKMQQVVQVAVPMKLLAVVLVISPALQRSVVAVASRKQSHHPGSSMDAVRLPEQLQLWCT